MTPIFRIQYPTIQHPTIPTIPTIQHPTIPTIPTIQHPILQYLIPKKSRNQLVEGRSRKVDQFSLQIYLFRPAHQLQFNLTNYYLNYINLLLEWWSRRKRLISQRACLFLISTNSSLASINLNKTIIVTCNL